VRTRLGFAASPSLSPSPLASGLGLSRGPTLMTFFAGFDPDELGAFLRFFGGTMFSGVVLISGWQRVEGESTLVVAADSNPP